MPRNFFLDLVTKQFFLAARFFFYWPKNFILAVRKKILLKKKLRQGKKILRREKKLSQYQKNLDLSNVCGSKRRRFYYGRGEQKFCTVISFLN